MKLIPTAMATQNTRITQMVIFLREIAGGEYSPKDLFGFLFIFWMFSLSFIFVTLEFCDMDEFTGLFRIATLSKELLRFEELFADFVRSLSRINS